MIWLIGNKGMLGSDVEKKLSETGMEYIATDLDVDITDYNELEKFVKNKEITWIINCSAYTAVDKAEDEPDKAYKINADGVLNIAKIAKKKNAKLIHFSTDYVFSGKKDGAYTEEDQPDPIGIYGKSKRKGEENIISEYDKYFIIRIAWLYGQHGPNIIKTMLRLLNERDEVGFVNDQWGSPSFTVDVADLIVKVISENSDKFGIYHFTNEGKANWFNVLEEVYKNAKKNILIKKVTKIKQIATKDFPTKAVRPANSYLSKEKVKKSFNITIRSWQEALEEFIKSIASVI